MTAMESLVSEILKRDRKIILKDATIKPSFKDKILEKPPIIADFTEYSPLHNGHYHCMSEAKKKVPDGIFVAVVPGPLERSGRGLPYIMTREARAESAVAVGADIVVEGPPMGVMGSGQYSLCLAKMFQALGADFIPRGYKPVNGFNPIMDRISHGHGVAPKPYKMVDMQTKEVLLEGKLEEDNYVISSLSKSLTKIGFEFKDKFIFIKRITGVSGTLIRQAVLDGDIAMAEEMIPPETRIILEEEMENSRAPLHDVRDEDTILETANTYTKDELMALSLIDERTAENIIQERPFSDLVHLKKCITWGFSTHYQQRVLSSLEAKVDKEIIYKYIENYPSLIRVLNYNDKHVLQEFKNRIPHRRLEIWQ
ncbi:nucleotidyltransferase family protein [Methanobacterium alcaliphilum]|uniref:nucleotidyltransferase family protein n=1 Tax=Methanobacterium alcaliphilum TaxID=392018 RepID=UPI00200AEA24|nr:nucleotidyltransferase family protein [Methanobacterium alcaliphilum]MCK9150580.1 nucleotidyltransferase family protein [Methanobacterium alcaliphilum]